jgi:hypothetical protein
MPIAFEQLHDLPQKGSGLPIVARGEAVRAGIEIRANLEWEIPKRVSDDLSLLGTRTGFSRMASHPEKVLHVDRRVPDPPLIPERLSHGFGFAKIPDHPVELSERPQRSSEVEAEIDGLLQRLAGLRQML